MEAAIKQSIIYILGGIMRVYIDTVFSTEHSWYVSLGVIAKKIGYVYELHIELLFFAVVFEYVGETIG